MGWTSLHGLDEACPFSCSPVCPAEKIIRFVFLVALSVAMIYALMATNAHNTSLQQMLKLADSTHCSSIIIAGKIRKKVFGYSSAASY
jgi:hypothetical protein